jgi:hypothetical protein
MTGRMESAAGLRMLAGCWSSIPGCPLSRRLAHKAPGGASEQDL